MSSSEYEPADTSDAESTATDSLETSTLLPPQIPPEKPTIVLDVDQTLIFSIMDDGLLNFPERFDFTIQYETSGQTFFHYVIKRPGLDEFLEKLASKYELIVFTAGLKEYADLVLDQIDPKGLISYRLYREACTYVDGKFLKDLSKLGRDVKKMILIDDNPDAGILFPDNMIIVPEFVGDFEDEVLTEIGEFLDGCSEYEDLRVAIAQDTPKDDDHHSGDES